MKTNVNYHLAIDIGASSGRHILGSVQGGKLILEEIFRFENNLSREGESLVWDIDGLFESVKAGIKECAKIGKIPSTISIDTWGVDYVLLDKDKKELKPVYCYRDRRTKQAAEAVEKIMPFEKLYSITGIQRQEFNTVYQLWSDKESGKLDKAEYFLMIPAYLSYKLTGVIENEYTNASTTGMVNAKIKEWDNEIISALGYPKRLFKKLMTPCSQIGGLTEELQKEVGFDAEVIFCPSHDTASAVAACPLDSSSIYISSGTWSLIGVESKEAILSEEALKANFANEGGIEYRFRVLKNYMGMWLFQNIRRNINKSMTYDEMMNLAKESQTYEFIDVNHQSFVAPENMINAVKEYLKKPDMELGEVLNTVYHSLAASYKKAAEEIEKVTGRKFNRINIIGGGCRDSYLNALTAEYTKKRVAAGPVEATATGNIAAQLIYSKECQSLSDVRELIKGSFEVNEV